MLCGIHVPHHCCHTWLAAHCPFTCCLWQGCTECATGKMNTRVGTVCGFCPSNTVLPLNSTECTPCLNVPVDKIVRQGASDCGDLVCLPISVGPASNCILQAEEELASKCTQDGFGWNHRRTDSCDVCSVNFVSIVVFSTFRNVRFNRCVACPRDHYTADIGMSTCEKCPLFHIRQPSDPVCVLCPSGDC